MAVINAGFAAYDGYKVSREKQKRQWHPIGKVKRVYRAVKIVKGLGKSNWGNLKVPI